MKKSRDIFYRKAKELGFRARSAFKLLDVDKAHDIFKGVERAVDLCAAPGSWSQVLSKKLSKENAKADTESKETKNNRCPVIAVDLQEMAPIEGVHIVQGDITSIKTANIVLDYFKGEKAQLVICDGAPDVTGLHDVDEYVQAQLLLAALNITTHLLSEGGTFVAKIFKGPCHKLLRMQLEVFFEEVYVMKPESSREASAEHFVACKGFHIPKGYKPFLFSAIPEDKLGYMSRKDRKDRKETLEDRNVSDIIVPFLACGDLSGFNKKIGQGDSKEFGTWEETKIQNSERDMLVEQSRGAATKSSEEKAGPRTESESYMSCLRKMLQQE
mmetsp:Transcript_4604/g.6883  ORF Transcript_4604/g.6883 Transcript_4604/m.6883 type:complete len:328 (-) Transcript_4604:66-1049(-)